MGSFIGPNFVGIIGYADYLFLMSPTLNGLQKMLQVCEHYTKDCNLRFSTNSNPKKSKTKCMAFLQRKRDLNKLKLCGDLLPWVVTGKHLGARIENKPGNILNQDMKEKCAQYIQQNNELMQEFSFAHSSTRCNINAIFNSHFTGSVLWDLFGWEAEMIYNTWSISIRKMFCLDQRSHRYFIEPVSKIKYIKIAFMKRFIKFTEQLACSTKRTTRNVFHIIKHDCRRITGHNL